MSALLACFAYIFPAIMPVPTESLIYNYTEAASLALPLLHPRTDRITDRAQFPLYLWRAPAPAQRWNGNERTRHSNMGKGPSWGPSGCPG